MKFRNIWRKSARETLMPIQARIAPYVILLQLLLRIIHEFFYPNPMKKKQNNSLRHANLEISHQTCLLLRFKFLKGKTVKVVEVIVNEINWRVFGTVFRNIGKLTTNKAYAESR